MTLTVIAVIFGVFAIALVVLLIYKSTLMMGRGEPILFWMTPVRTCTKNRRNCWLRLTA